MRLVIPSLAAGAVAFALAGAAPAGAYPAADSVTRISSWRSGVNYCLDASADGGVNAHRCSTANGYMKWKWIHKEGFVRLQNQETGQCLAQSGGSLATIRCDSDGYDHVWRARDRDEGRVSINNVRSNYYLGLNGRGDPFLYSIQDSLADKWDTPAVA
ncbi:RICIN domain-containing protein [Streptomyces sp. NA04227]|uniref:RICIN domain-containing protein n=1 Tax=Streptomyces sp. NA04227 TaxID=2742136 RepID=UPI001590B087|nr:RICIN domain-containing protein [Streptomyces sp. NA04227]QKW07924.1 RICIN domain-containing protein [Streptomyces sp. NA04227]